MAIKKEYLKIAKRFDRIMWDLGIEYLCVVKATDGDCSSIYDDRKYYDIEDGVTIGWMQREAEYWLSCYYEPGHCRCDDKHEGKDGYKVWVSETGKLNRLIKALEKYDATAVIEDGFEPDEDDLAYTGEHHVGEIVIHHGHECIVTDLWFDQECEKNGITITPAQGYGFAVDIYDDQL